MYKCTSVCHVSIVFSLTLKRTHFLEMCNFIVRFICDEFFINIFFPWSGPLNGSLNGISQNMNVKNLLTLILLLL